MSINVYPAFKDAHNQVSHADNWDDASTLNIANGNFYAMVDTMGIGHLAATPGSMSLKAMELALQTSPRTNYTDRLKQICAVARIKKASLIAFS